MIQFSIGLSALQTAEQGLAIAGNNLANATTPGYHVQSATIASLGSTPVDGLSIGMGASITDVNRAVSSQLDSALTQQTSQNGFVDASLNASTQIEQAISNGTTSPSTQLEGLLNSLQALSANPSNSTSLQATVQSAQAVASSFNSAAADLTQIQQGLDSSINGDVSQINSIASQIANLNGQLSTLPNSNGSNNSILDQQSQLINQLAQLTNIQVESGNNGQTNVILGGVAIVAGNQTTTLSAGTNNTDAVTINSPGNSTPLTVTGGDLGGLLSQRNQTLADYQNRLDTLAQQVAASFNAVQSTGLGSSGGLTQLTSQNEVTSVSAKLSSAGLTPPPQSGTLYIGVTNTATGQRTITAVPINPQSQSLQGVATAIGNDVPQLSAYVNSQNGTLSLVSAPGYSFDFTGGTDSSPSTNFPGGSTTTPTIGGTYTGTTNDQYTFSFPASGTVGVTPNLQAQVTNQAGDVVGTINVGQGYQPGQPIAVANGVTVSLAAGSVVSGDSFSTPVVANPDAGGILNSLGLNTLFTGNTAESLSVSANIVADPSQLATSTTGQAGDTSNLQRFAALGTSTVLSNGTQTFSQYANQMVSDIGTGVQSLTSQQSTNQTLTTSITTQQQSVEGVDTNQELSKVMQYQQMFEMASKYISAVNDAIQNMLTTISA